MSVSQFGGGNRRRVTMRVIAERVGVHVSTVSRALRADPAGNMSEVSAEVVERIRVVAGQLGYRPDPYAASLTTRRTRAIGVLVPQLTDVVLATIYQGIDEYAIEHGYQTLVANTHDDRQERQERVELMLSRRVDGLILGDANIDGAFLRELAAVEIIPFILVNRRAEGHVSVTCDDVTGGRMAGEHLAELGHQHVGIVAGLPWASTGIDRSRGCQEALAERGIVVSADYMLHSTFDAEGGRRAGEQLLDLDPRPTAIFAVNDYTALGVMGAARTRGLRVGEDLAVVGFNDITIARDLPVPLTTLSNPLNAMGRSAAHLLLEILSGNTVQSVRLEPTLAVRDSTVPSDAPPPYRGIATRA